MEPITRDDLILINNLSSRTYSENTILSNASEQEKSHLVAIKLKLRKIAEFFSKKYEDSYGPFQTSVVTGNDIALGGTKFKRIWSGIFKGADNKQYASQISFVMNPKESCLDVGFYFGRASGHSRNKEQRIELQGQLKNLGVSLSKTIGDNQNFRQKYFEIFDFGFTAYSNEQKTAPQEWYTEIINHTKTSQIVAKLYPNDFGIIEHSTIDSFVSQIIFLMGGLSSLNNDVIPTIKPLTPGQRAKQAERLAEIGNKGELYIMEQERNKLKSFGITNSEYPKHVALESSAYGYDIISLNKEKQEIFIEVKTTTRTSNDPNSKQFFISSNEYEVYENNKNRFELYRVYDIENSPSFEVLEMQNIIKSADGYVCRY